MLSAKHVLILPLFSPELTVSKDWRRPQVTSIFCFKELLTPKVEHYWPWYDRSKNCLREEIPGLSPASCAAVRPNSQLHPNHHTLISNSWLSPLWKRGTTVTQQKPYSNLERGCFRVQIVFDFWIPGKSVPEIMDQSKTLHYSLLNQIQWWMAGDKTSREKQSW